MELLSGDRLKLLTDEVDPFDSGLVTLADLASPPPPRKLRPIRYGDKLTSEDHHPLDILAGTLDNLSELGCFNAPSGDPIVDVQEGRDLACGFPEDNTSRPGSGPGTACDGVSISSSVDSYGESLGGVEVAATGKRKRKTREKLEHFLEKLVGSVMKRQEKMHEQLIELIEKKERERILREEAWKQLEMERMKQDEEARAKEMSRSSAIIALIQTVIGQNLPNQCGEGTCEYAETAGDNKLCDSNSRRWPKAEMQALITMRSEMEGKVGKGSIWDEISERMVEKGYKRSAKKCKEKWENMNKYYRKVMEGGKKLSEQSKTSCYFHELESFYNGGWKRDGKTD